MAPASRGALAEVLTTVRTRIAPLHQRNEQDTKATLIEPVLAAFDSLRQRYLQRSL